MSFCGLVSPNTTPWGAVPDSRAEATIGQIWQDLAGIKTANQRQGVVRSIGNFSSFLVTTRFQMPTSAFNLLLTRDDCQGSGTSSDDDMLNMEFNQ